MRGIGREVRRRAIRPDADPRGYRARPLDDRLEDALAAPCPVVVVHGGPGAGSTRAVRRALGRMFGGGTVVSPADGHDTDLPALVAGRHGDVTLLDGAPLQVLDQLTPDLLEARAPLVVTTRSDLVGADHPHHGTATVLAEVGLSVPPRDGVMAGLAPFPRGAVTGLAACRAATVRVALDWERLGVPRPLGPPLLRELVAAELATVGEDPEPAELVAALRHCLGGGLGARRGAPVLVRTRRCGGPHLAPHPVLARHARAARPTASVVRHLVAGLEESERRLVARVALARGEWIAGADEVAAALLEGLEPGQLGPASVLRVADAMVSPTRAVPWLRPVAEHADEPWRAAARLGLGLRLERCATAWPAYGYLVDEACEHLLAVSDDQRAQLALGRLAHRQGDAAVARSWWERAATGPDPTPAARAREHLSEDAVAR